MESYLGGYGPGESLEDNSFGIDDSSEIDSGENAPAAAPKEVTHNTQAHGPRVTGLDVGSIQNLRLRSFCMSIIQSAL